MCTTRHELGPVHAVADAVAGLVLLIVVVAWPGPARAETDFDPTYTGHFMRGADHELGRFGFARDFAEAARWYRRVADGGYPPAQYRLGQFYAGGLGVEQDDVQAYVWLWDAIWLRRSS